MSDKHSLQIRVIAAREALDRAYANCEHWDYEAGSHDGNAYECCYLVDDARRELRAAVKARDAK